MTATVSDSVRSGPETVTVMLERVASPRTYLMCEPRYFAVQYAINPWMDPSVPVDTELAVRQWHGLVDTYRRLGHDVVQIEPVDGLPDMVFAANGATVANNRVYGAKFLLRRARGRGPGLPELVSGRGLRCPCCTVRQRR